MFNPTKDQAHAKARFHNKAEKNPLLGPVDSLSIQKMEKLAGVSDLNRWMEQDGFREWFLNSDHNKELVDSSVEPVIKTAMKILEMDSDGEKGSPRISDKIAIMRLLLEHSSFGSKKVDDSKYKDSEIANMDEERLDKLINKSLRAQQRITEELEIAIGD